MTDDFSKPSAAPSSTLRKVAKGCLITIVVILIVTGGCMLLQQGFH